MWLHAHLADQEPRTPVVAIQHVIRTNHIISVSVVHRQDERLHRVALEGEPGDELHHHWHVIEEH